MAIFSRKQGKRFIGRTLLADRDRPREEKDVLAHLFGGKSHPKERNDLRRDTESWFAAKTAQEVQGRNIQAENYLGEYGVAAVLDETNGFKEENKGELLFRKLEEGALLQDPKVGEELEVTVGYIRDSGAAVFDGEGTRRWLYIGEITNGYVARIDDYLRVGDSIKVRVISSQVPDRWRVSAKVLGGLEPKYRLDSQTEGSDSGEMWPTLVQGGTPLLREAPAVAGGEEMEMLTRFLEGKLGNVSPSARARFKGMVEREGTVRVALAIPALLEEWDPWQAFLGLLEKRVQGKKAVGEG